MTLRTPWTGTSSRETGSGRNALTCTTTIMTAPMTAVGCTGMTLRSANTGSLALIFNYGKSANEKIILLQAMIINRKSLKYCHV